MYPETLKKATQAFQSIEAPADRPSAINGTRQPQVSCEISRQSVLLEDLEKSILCLSEKLEPVRASKPEPGSKPDRPEEPALCGVAQSLYANNAHLGRLQNAIRTLLLEVEV